MISDYHYDHETSILLRYEGLNAGEKITADPGSFSAHAGSPTGPLLTATLVRPEQVVPAPVTKIIATFHSPVLYGGHGLVI